MKLLTVLSQDGLPASKREEFFQLGGAGFRGVVYGMGTRQACWRARLIGSFNEQNSPGSSPFTLLL